MAARQENPFDVTKAVDFTDTEIRDTWVDWHGKAARQFVGPGSRIATFLTGGKGGGRTHRLRYYSYPLQRLRHGDDISEALQTDGYVGIYLRCSGLNAFRFSGKGQPADTWMSVFAYYMDVWLGRLVLRVIEQHCGAPGVVLGEDRQRDFVAAVESLFDQSLMPSAGAASIHDLGRAFDRRQREIDYEINNAGLTHDLSVDVSVVPGRIVQGVPSAATRHLPPFRDITFVYLIDEYENFTKDQQRYINTLIREKEIPTAFVIGSRRYGIRTQETLNARETNKIGSEYEVVELEDMYMKDKREYRTFCRAIVSQRLRHIGLRVPNQNALKGFFKTPQGSVEERAERYVRERARSAERMWMRTLKRQLHKVGVEPSTVIPYLEIHDSPLHEKFAVFLFYRSWAAGRPLPNAAQQAREETETLVHGGESAEQKKIHTTYMHYRGDLYAQILADLGSQPEYSGLDDFVLMSGYLPRNLLVVLKQVVRWSAYLGEQPFSDSVISLTAQRRGIRDASRWFLTDSKGLGRLGESTERAILRLGSLFRSMRYADRPVEVSCSAFETDRQGLSDGALETLDSAIANSLIIRVPIGRRERNTGVLRHKYQLHPMLSPIFDLSLGRRGTARFSADLLNGVFDPIADEGYFGHERRKILGRLRAPFGRKPSNQGQLGLGAE